MVASASSVRGLAQQGPATPVDAHAHCECSGRRRGVEYVLARGPVTAREAGREARAEQQTRAVTAFRTVGIQFAVPVRPNGIEAARGHHRRDERDGAERDPGDCGPSSGPHRGHRGSWYLGRSVSRVSDRRI